MVQLSILIGLITSVSFIKMRDYLIVGLLAGLFTWNILIGLLVVILSITIGEPYQNYKEGKPIFYSKGKKWKDLLSGARFYDITNGRIVLMVEIFILIVLISENIVKWL